MSTHELLAPAGHPDAGYAALQYGADAVYCGLTSFSARAEAQNFTPAELALFARYAHSLTPKRRVYLTLNTLLQEDELGSAVDTMATALDCGADALIVQDLGLINIARDYFPDAELHASTQMAIHNLEGARAAKALGFRRVTLARELTLAEIADICANSGVEIETFIHGTLCYSYSGLCLFSSMLTGRSGNRGRCVYSCREAVEIPEPGRPERTARAHPFSLKDMALCGDVLKLARAGVKSFKIEGRKKSPLYVGATVDYYRKLLDGKITPGSEEDEEHRARLQTIFARPWTKLFFHTTHNPDVADTEVVGHRGAPIGTIGGIVKTPTGAAIRFRPSRAVERHDGLQIDIPGDPRPFGFAIDDLYSIKSGRAPEPVFAAPAGAEVAVPLPADAPPLAPGLPLYQSSSQEVKRSYPYARPRSETPEPDLPMDIHIKCGEDGVHITARATLPAWLPATGQKAHAPQALRDITVTLQKTLPAFPARDAAGAEAAAKKSFARTGGSRFFLQGWTFGNPAALFVKPGDWNAIRRETLEQLEQRYAEAISSAAAAVHASLAQKKENTPAGQTARWSLVLQDAAQLEKFSAAELDGIHEIILPHTTPPTALGDASGKLGKDKLRFHLPLIARAEQFPRIRESVRTLLDAGYRSWLVPSLGRLSLFEQPAHPARKIDADLCADWPLYALNSRSVAFLQSLGFTACTCSPEDDSQNIARLHQTGGNLWLPVFADVPLFIAASCAHKNIHLCNTCAPAAPLTLTMEKSGTIKILPQCSNGGSNGGETACGTTVLSASPYSLLSRVPALLAQGMRNFRVDLRHRPRGAEEVLALWRGIRENTFASPSTDGNHTRLLT